MDLMAFSDETLCRTVSMLRVPVVASVGHHTDRTLIDDVAAVSCSTPTHAAEAAVPVHCEDARERLRALSAMSRAPAAHVERHRLRLHQLSREMRAAAARGTDARARAASGAA